MKTETYLPEHYTPVEEPFFSGRGNHSVLALENICEQYKEWGHQMQVKSQGMKERIQELEAVLQKAEDKLYDFERRIQTTKEEDAEIAKLFKLIETTLREGKATLNPL